MFCLIKYRQTFKLKNSNNFSTGQHRKLGVLCNLLFSKCEHRAGDGLLGKHHGCLLDASHLSQICTDTHNCDTNATTS